MRKRRELINLREGAARLARSPHTLRRWVREGLLPYVRIRGRIAFDAAEVARFIEAHRHVPADEAQP